MFEKKAQAYLVGTLGALHFGLSLGLIHKLYTRLEIQNTLAYLSAASMTKKNVLIY